MRKWSGIGCVFAGLALHVLALCVYSFGVLAAIQSIGDRPVKIDLKVLPDGSRQPELFIVPEK